MADAMITPNQAPLRKTRLALAYLFFAPFAFLGVQAFLYVKRLWPTSPLHPEHLLIQLALGGTVILLLPVAYLQLVSGSGFLSDREIAHLRDKFRGRW